MTRSLAVPLLLAAALLLTDRPDLPRPDDPNPVDLFAGKDRRFTYNAAEKCARACVGPEATLARAWRKDGDQVFFAGPDERTLILEVHCALDVNGKWYLRAVKPLTEPASPPAPPPTGRG